MKELQPVSVWPAAAQAWAAKVEHDGYVSQPFSTDVAAWQHYVQLVALLGSQQGRTKPLIEGLVKNNRHNAVAEWAAAELAEGPAPEWGENEDCPSPEFAAWENRVQSRFDRLAPARPAVLNGVDYPSNIEVFRSHATSANPDGVGTGGGYSKVE